MAIGESTLPFARGGTWSDYGEVTPTSTAVPTYLLGRIYEVQDEQNSTGNPVRLRVVQNNSSAALTTARKLYTFSTAAKDFGRKVSGLSGAGNVCKPMDDAYAESTSIPAYDLFYVVEEGPCKVRTEASSVNLAQFGAVASDASGLVNGAVAADGEYVVGRIDEASTTTNTSVVIHVAAGISLPSEG